MAFLFVVELILFGTAGGRHRAQPHSDLDGKSVIWYELYPSSSVLYCRFTQVTCKAGPDRAY